MIILRGGHMVTKVTFIVAAYNTKKYLKKCLDSLVNQTMKEIEVIVSDDCSKENLSEILQEYSIDSRVKYIRLSEHKDTGGARNAAFEQALGEYVAFIDSDDWVDLNYADKLYDAAKQYHAEIAMSGLIRNFTSYRKEPLYKCKYDQYYKISGTVAFKIMTGEYDYGFKIIPSASNKLYSKQYLLENKITFIENILFEDQLYSYQTLLSGCNVVCVPDTLYHHFKRDGSIVQSFSLKHLEDMDTAYAHIRAYLKENNFYEQYKNNYYNSLTHFYNLIIREIFEFVKDESERKKLMKRSFIFLRNNIDFEEYIDYCSAEEIRRHLQPYIENTLID